MRVELDDGRLIDLEMQSAVIPGLASRLLYYWARSLSNSLAAGEDYTKLPKLGLAAPERQAKLERWARFLRAETPEELERLATEDEIMSVAKHALEDLSNDPVYREMLRDRADSQLMLKHLIASSRDEGRAEGRDEGRAEGRDEGRAEGLRIAARSLCSVFHLNLAEERLAKIDTPELTRLVDFITSNRRLPDGF